MLVREVAVPGHLSHAHLYFDYWHLIMRILLLQDTYPPLAGGGSAIIAKSVAQALHAAGAEVVVMCIVHDRAEAGGVIEDGIAVERVFAPRYHHRWRAYRSLYNPLPLAALREILQHVKPDVVNAHNIHSYISYAALRIAHMCGARVYLTAHDVQMFNYGKLTHFINPAETAVPEKFDYRISALDQLREQRYRYNPLRNLAITYLVEKYVKKVIAVSDALRDALTQNGSTKVTTIRNGIDASLWQVSADKVYTWKSERGIGDSAIVFSGRLSGLKGAVPMMEALKLVVDKVPDAQLLVVGSRDAYAEKMLEHARELGVEKMMVFTGWVSGDDLHTAYHAGAVVAVPSVCFDSFPTINLEAFACGKPVVATCFGGSRELVQDGVSGYIVNPFNREMLAERIIELLRHPDKARAFGAVGRARVENEFTLERQATEYLTVFSNK